MSCGSFNVSLFSGSLLVREHRAEFSLKIHLRKYIPYLILEEGGPKSPPAQKHFGDPSSTSFYFLTPIFCDKDKTPGVETPLSLPSNKLRQLMILAAIYLILRVGLSLVVRDQAPK